MTEILLHKVQQFLPHEEIIEHVVFDCWYLFGFLQWERQRRLRYLIVKYEISVLSFVQRRKRDTDIGPTDVLRSR